MAPGYIYVEAQHVSHVIPACEGFHGYQGRFKKIVLVPVHDAVALLRTQPSDLRLRDKSWVRIRHGDYAGDLAYCCYLEEDPDARKSERTRGFARVKVIPRISKEPDSKRFLKRKRGAARPPRAFFEHWAWPQAIQQESNPDAWVFRSAVFENGLMDLQVPVNVLNLGMATPSQSDLKLWTTCPDKFIQQFAWDSLRLLSEEFWVNDRVEVMSGDQLGRRGIVQTVGEQELLVSFWTEVSNDELEGHKREVAHTAIAIQSSYVRKTFEVGDYVVAAAVSDQDKEEWGFVVAVDAMHNGRQGHKVTIVKHGNYEEVSGRPWFFDL